MRLFQQQPGASTAAVLLLLFVVGPGPLVADDPTLPASPDHPVAGSPREGTPPAEALPSFPPEETSSAIAEAPGEEEAEEAAEPVLDERESLLLTAETDPRALGPLSIGTPDAGLLVNPVPFPEGPYWRLKDPSESWGTQETIDYLTSAIQAVEARHPGSPRVVIGDLSRPAGGRLNRHRSHQAGRDADIGFYYRRGEVDAFLTARKRDLDLPRTWTLVRALITETDVDRIFVDRSLISVLYQHAVSEGEDRAWLDELFGRSGAKGIIQHERRHRDHLHVRFFNPRAQETGRLTYAVLVEKGVAPPPVVKHTVRRGETLGHLARRYGTSVSAIRRANGLRGSFLRAGRSYTIPIRRMPPDEGPVLVPPRRLPPEMRTDAPSPAGPPDEALSPADEPASAPR